MAERVFDRDTLLDLTVNVIPLGIIGFFIVLYTIYRPLGWDLTTMVIVYALHVIPFVGLAVLTYVSARAISRDEKEATKTATEHDVGEQPRTHRQTGDSSEEANDDDVAVETENTAAEPTDENSAKEDSTNEASVDEHSEDASIADDTSDENRESGADEEATNTDD